MQCLECGKRFRKSSNFKNHLLIHSEGRSFNCDQCNKTFLLPLHLQIHKKSHADVRRYLCSLCGKRFKWFGNLKWHQKIRICVKLRLRSQRSWMWPKIDFLLKCRISLSFYIFCWAARMTLKCGLYPMLYPIIRWVSHCTCGHAWPSSLLCVTLCWCVHTLFKQWEKKKKNNNKLH